jgi:hypothetical protein
MPGSEGPRLTDGRRDGIRFILRHRARVEDGRFAEPAQDRGVLILGEPSGHQSVR